MKMSNNFMEKLDMEKVNATNAWNTDGQAFYAAQQAKIKQAKEAQARLNKRIQIENERRKYMNLEATRINLPKNEIKRLGLPGDNQKGA